MSDEVTLALMRQAAEKLRAVNHAAYGAPRDPVALYDRTGALFDVLLKLEQVAQFLANAADDGAAVPVAGLFSADATSPVEHLLGAHSELAQVARLLGEARRGVDAAWQLLSLVGLSDGGVS